MASPGLSVIVPAYNKRDVLAETLAALEGQDVPGGYEVIVVDDGSTDGTLEWLHEQVGSVRAGAPSPYRSTFLSQANLGAGAARNAGAEQASGQVLLFLDADIVATPGLIEAHWMAHQRHPRAIVVGRIQPWPEAGGGPAYQVFAASSDLGPTERLLTYGFGVTQNLSISMGEFRALGGFQGDFPWEDVEFAYRAHCSGLPLIYQPDALGYHNHPLSLDQLCQKTWYYHKQMVKMFRQHPSMIDGFDYLQDKLPVTWGREPAGLVLRKVWRTALAVKPSRAALRTACEVLEQWWPSPALLDFLFWKLIGAYQWLGLREGMAEYGWRPRAEY